MTPPNGSLIPRRGHPGRSAKVAGVQPFGGEVVVDRLLCGGNSLFTEPQRLPNPNVYRRPNVCPRWRSVSSALLIEADVGFQP